MRKRANKTKITNQNKQQTNKMKYTHTKYKTQKNKE